MMTRNKTASSKLWTVDLAGVLLCALVTAAIYFAGIAPLLADRTAQDALRTRLVQDEAAARSLKATVLNLQRRLENVRQTFPEKPVVLQSADKLNQQLGDLIGLARQCGLNVEQVRPGESRTTKHYLKTTIRINASGDHTQCVNFLGRLHEQFADMAVDRITLAANPQEKHPIAQYEIDVVWHTKPG